MTLHSCKVIACCVVKCFSALEVFPRFHEIELLGAGSRFPSLVIFREVLICCVCFIVVLFVPVQSHVRTLLLCTWNRKTREAFWNTLADVVSYLPYLSELLHPFSPSRPLMSADQLLLQVLRSRRKLRRDRGFSIVAPQLKTNLPLHMRGPFTVHF